MFKSINVQYVYIPSETLSRDDFSFRDTFKALGLQSPEQQLAFHCRGIFDYKQWNTRLPLRCPKRLLKHTQMQSKLFPINGKDLHVEVVQESDVGSKTTGPPTSGVTRQQSIGSSDAKRSASHAVIDDEPAHLNHKEFVPGCGSCEMEKAHQSHKVYDDKCDLCYRTEHHQELVRDCFKRLIIGASKACKELKAVYFWDTNWSPDRNNFLAKCLNDGDKVPRLGLCETKDLNTDLVNELISIANHQLKPFDDKYDPNNEENKKCLLEINSTFWQEASALDKAAQREQPKIIKKDDQGGYVETIPDPGVTHLIISEDRALLEKKFDEQIRSAMLLINGGPYLCRQFCNFFHQQRPIFIFKYSGGAADAAAYALEITEGFHIFKTSHLNATKKLVRNDDNRPGFNRDEWFEYLKWLDKPHLRATGELDLYNRIAQVGKST